MIISCYVTIMYDHNILRQVEAYIQGSFALLLQTVFVPLTHKYVPVNMCNLLEENKPLFKPIAYCKSGNNGGSKKQHNCNLTLMWGFKYSRNDNSEKIVKNKHVVMITERKKDEYYQYIAILGLFLLVKNTYLRLDECIRLL